MSIFKSHSGTAIFSYSLFAASAVILMGVLYFAFNIQVIKDWKLTLPQGDIHAGDTIVVSSTYTKLRQVTGTSTRTIECATHGVFISFPLNKVAANRAPGRAGTGAVVNIPSQMQGITSLPDTCRICIALSYPVLPGRSVPYFNCTENFTLLPKNGAASSEPQSATQTSPPQISSESRPQVSATSSPNTTTSVQSPQPNNPQPVNPQPSLVQQITQPITNLIRRL